MSKIKGWGLVDLMTLLKTGGYGNMLKVIDQSQHTAPGDQSENNVLFRRSDFI